MEDGTPHQQHGGGAGPTASPPRTPPPPPEPRAVDESRAVAAAALKVDEAGKTDDPLRLTSEQWDISSISALAAMRMLAQALEGLAEATGDIPPTPPVSRPATPRREPDENALLVDRKPSLHIGSPEAHPCEPMSIHHYHNDRHDDTSAAHAAIARRFFSKTAPPFTLTDWLLRLHKYCPHSPGVYLAAAAFTHRLCVSDLLVPATNRTIHRLALAALRVAAKALEDHKWSQERMARMGGVSKLSLMKMEMTLCYLLDFNLWIDERVLARGMFLLQQAASQGKGARGKLSEEFKLKLPLRRQLARQREVVAA